MTSQNCFPPAGRDLPGASYLEPIAAAGVERFLANGRGLSLRVHIADQRLVPVLISDGAPGKASFVFPSGHYLDYPIHEIARTSRFWTRATLGAALFPLQTLCTLGQLDKVAYVNHWLLVGGPPLELSLQALDRLIHQLVVEHPEHALVFSAIVPAQNSGLTKALIAMGGRAVQSRLVHLLDPSRPLSGGVLKNVRATRNADKKLYLANVSRRTADPAILLEQIGRLHCLYSQLYVNRHAPKLNPRYESAFFELLLTCGLFSVAGWLNGGVVEAFNVQLRSTGLINWSICGIDCEAPRSRGLFRIVVGEDIAVAEREHLLVNWGGGNPSFKEHRGAASTHEYDIVFDRHLRAERRFPWWLLQELRAWKNGDPLRNKKGPAGKARSAAATANTSRTP